MGGICCATREDPDVLEVCRKAAVASEKPSQVKEVNRLSVRTSGSSRRASRLWRLWPALALCGTVAVGAGLEAHVLLLSAVVLAAFLLTDSSAAKPAAALPHTCGGPAITDADLDKSRPRPTEAEAQKMRARGEDPFVGQRLNYLGGAKVPFEPLLRDLQPCEREAFENFERRFPEALAECRVLDRSRFHQIPDRFTMLVFLQADSYKVDESIKRLLKTLVWRQTSGIDDFITNPDWRVVNLFHHLRCRRFVGLDKHGRPLLVDALGDFFGSDNGCRAMPMSKWLLAFGFELSLTSAWFRKASTRQNRAIHRIAYIGDLSGLRISQCRALIPFLRQLTTEVDTHFPEFAGTVLLINAPYFFAVLFALAKVFLDKRTADTIIVKSGIPTDFIIENFGDECVPAEFGGRLNYTVTRVRPLNEVLEGLGLPGPLTENDEYDATCAGAQWVPMLAPRKDIS